MDALRGLYVAVLSLIILLSGCFGSGVFDNAEGDVDGNEESGGTMNLPPLIELVASGATEATPAYSSATGELIGYTEYNASFYRAIADLDGNITSAGWDFNLDGQIDVSSSTDFRAVDNISIPSTYWVNATTIADYATDLLLLYQELGVTDFQIATIAFIAIDDDGAMSAELITINNIMAILYELAEEEASGNGNSGTQNTYTAYDAADDASAASEGQDTLFRMQMTGSDDLAWAFVSITLSVGDNVYTCSVAAGDDCSISQQTGDNDNAWEPGEYIFLSEGAEEICSAQGCTVDISVTYSGQTVAGDTSVVVN